MSFVRSFVRWGYAPFMMLGLTSLAYWIVTSADTWVDYLWLAPLLAASYATAFAAEKIAPFFTESPRSNTTATFLRSNITSWPLNAIFNVSGVNSKSRPVVLTPESSTTMTVRPAARPAKPPLLVEVV